MMTRAVALLIASGILGFLFQNCAGTDLSTTATGTTTFSSTSTGNFSAWAATSSIYVNNSTQLLYSGGTSPYTFTLVSGTGYVDSTSAVFTGTGIGTATIRAADSSGQSVYIYVTVLATGSTSTTVTCGTYTGASSQTCYGATNGSCGVAFSFGNLIPSGCRLTQAIVYAKHFNAVSGSCSTAASFSFTASGSGTSGTTSGKYAYLTATADLSSFVISLASYAGGWGSCSGNSCNACISDVSIDAVTTPY